MLYLQCKNSLETLCNQNEDQSQTNISHDTCKLAQKHRGKHQKRKKENVKIIVVVKLRLLGSVYIAKLTLQFALFRSSQNNAPECRYLYGCIQTEIIC